MKNLMKIAGGLLVLVGIIAAINLLHAQEAVQGGVVSLTDTNVDWNAMSDLEVMLQAVESVPPMPANSLPSAGTYWSAQHAPGTAEEWPPLPTPLGMGAWSLGNDGVYLLDDLNHDYASPKQSTSAATTSSGMMTTADVDINPADGGDDTNDDSGGGYSPQLSPVEEFGTNLWLEITNLTNNTADFMVSNTIADVEYEIQSRADLVQGNWNSEGFFFGSEITNWTPTSAIATNYPNLFYRIRSWIDSDGSGLPDWWQLKYFGHTGVDPYADPDGDGWNNLQEFQNGTDPTIFNAPPSPVFSVTPTANDNGEVISWNPAQGAVTGYTIYRNGSAVATVSASTFSYADSTVVNLSDPNDSDYPVYTVQANYSGSSYSSPEEGPFNPRLSVYPAIVRGAQGQYILLVPNIPSEATTIRFYPQPSGADYPDDFFDIETYNQPINYFMPSSTTSIIDVPVSSFTTNGQYAIPTSLMPLFGTYGSSISCRALGADGSAGAASTIFIANNYFLAESEIQARIPFIDGTEQLKENLAFQLEAADKLGSFSFYVEGANQAVSFPQNYAYAGFYFPLDFGSPQYNYAFLHPFKPFEDNYFYRNFVYAFTNLNSDGSLASGAFYSGGVLIPSTTLFSFNEYGYVSTGNTNLLAPQLSATNSRWLYSPYTPDNPGYGNIGITEAGTNLYLNSGQTNIFGLQYQSAIQTYSDGTFLYTNRLNSGGGIPNAPHTEFFYGQVTPPQLQTVGYYFAIPNQNYLPGHAGFNPNNFTNAMLITAVGQESLVTAWAKEEIVNGASGKYGFLEQYFDKAYLADGGGNIDTNQPTGVLSEYGEFLATDAGKTFLTTRPDGTNQGQFPIYTIALVLDKNHDGIMDTSFSGADATSASSPMTFWANNNYDRWDNDFPFNYPEQDDQQIAFCPAYPNTPTPDCNYSNVLANGFAYRAIPCTRDLEDFARLWVCGVTSNLLAALPTNSTVTLSWGDVGNPNSSNPTIDLFAAADADGGIGYQTNETIAAEQTNILQGRYVGRLTPGQSIQLNASQFANNWAGNYFIWCGVNYGSGGLTLTIADGNGNTLAQTTAYIQIVDVKQMYERWTVGDQPSVAPLTNALPVTEGLQPFASAFQYTPPSDPNTPYILLVHGYNMKIWEKDRFAETAFKRLYWQGYQGRFGAFNWPTAQNAVQFGASESQAWLSAQGLLNKLNDLNAEYPGHVYLAAHSLGNVVAGEALRLAGSTPVVNTYVAMQGAVASHAYDPSTTTYNLGAFYDGAPDCYAHYWTAGAPCYFNATAGAGTYVNFFNTNDWALNFWLNFQNLKPSLNLGYSYTAGTGAYYKNFGITELFFPGDRYELFANFIQAPCYALGMQINVGGAFITGTSTNQVNLPSIWPPDLSGHNYGDHIWHSAEFRSDNPQRSQFWNEVLVKMGLK